EVVRRPRPGAEECGMVEAALEHFDTAPETGDARSLDEERGSDQRALSRQEACLLANRQIANVPPQTFGDGGCAVAAIESLEQIAGTLAGSCRTPGGGRFLVVLEHPYAQLDLATHVLECFGE